MLKKLTKTFSNLDYVQGGKQISYGDVISYFDAELACGGIFHVIPLRYRADFCLSVMKISGPVPPHTDSEIKCTINFYAQPNGYTTTFYSPKPKARTYQVANQTNGLIYEKADLLPRASFTAAAGEAYLLNVAEVHGVEGGDGERTAICLGTDKHDFQAVLEMLQETGNA